MFRALTARATSVGVGSLLFQRRFGSSRHKVVTADDAAYLIPDGATVASAGFVAQGSPEELCAAIAKRFKETGSPKGLTIMFTGGPGDWDKRGLNHFAIPGLVRRTIGSHYGQVPMLAQMAQDNLIDSYNLPMGTISRMVRSAASKQAGHMTRIGLGTFVDPRIAGGKINKKTVEDIGRLIEVDGEKLIYYKALQIDVALCRGTTADPDGNITMERESLYGENKLMAMAARSSRGITMVQVERVGASGSLNPRDVLIPGTMVDCVVVAKPENHWMSYFTEHHAAACAEIRAPPTFKKMPLCDRKLVARRAALELSPGQVVNLGIGMPEGVAIVADEEKVLDHIELTTEPGIHGGVGLSGHEFGPAVNYNALLDMNHQFDFYNGGGLDICFLGMAEITPKGDVNVTRVGPKLTGPGGFIDISQSTKRVNLLGTFTAGGLEVEAKDGKLKIIKEGKNKKFVNKIPEITFSGDVANERGQVVNYITERAVFRLTKQGIELTEIAPGVDLQKDILAQMQFKPLIHEPLKTMNPDIFKEDLMKLRSKAFGTNISERMEYKKDTNTVFLNLSQVSIQTPDQIKEVELAIRNFVTSKAAGGKANIVANYEGFDTHPDLSQEWAMMAQGLQKDLYLTVRRFTGRAFARHKMGNTLKVEEHVSN